MNKQELSQELEWLKFENPKGGWALGFNAGVRKAQRVAKHTIEKQQKPVVPKCAEPFLKEAKCSTDVIQLFVDILHATDSDGFIWENWKWTADFYEWLAKDSDTLYILCDALRYGYEVEKEQLYYVKFPDLRHSSSDNVYGLKKTLNGEIRVSVFDKREIGKTKDSQLTEQEIKAIDERYWPFAVPVEQEEKHD